MATSTRPQRERKEAERLTYDEQVDDGGKEPPVGSGTPLGDIGALEATFKMSKYSDAAAALHQLVFKSKGKAGTQRKRLRTFAGIVYGDDPETERERYVERALKLNVGLVKEIMDLLCVDRSPKSFEDGDASKEHLVERLVEFLECPAAQKKEKKRKGSASSDAPAAKASKTTTAKGGDGTPLELALLRAVAKHQLEIADDATSTISAMVKAAEEYVGEKLPPAFKGILKELVAAGKAEDDDDDDDEAPPKQPDEAPDDDAAPDEEADEPPKEEEEAPPVKEKKKPGRKPGKKPAARKPAAKKTATEADEADEDEPAAAEEEEAKDEPEAAAAKADDDDDDAPAEKEDAAEPMETEDAEEKKETE